jgi:hypothetical protein
LMLKWPKPIVHDGLRTVPFISVDMAPLRLTPHTPPQQRWRGVKVA